ncbi:hypothetical protein [Coleofasciculus sp. H7-2]|uniref:hypothetical protein n=1 Tax=Coleofasciculus sp. H7-2 TaxID=3351545 RepID=UPI00366F9881
MKDVSDRVADGELDSGALYRYFMGRLEFESTHIWKAGEIPAFQSDVFTSCTPSLNLDAK